MYTDREHIQVPYTAFAIMRGECDRDAGERGSEEATGSGAARYNASSKTYSEYTSSASLLSIMNTVGRGAVRRC